MSELKEYTLDEVAKHTTTDSCWLVIGNDNNGEFVFVRGSFVYSRRHFLWTMGEVWHVTRTKNCMRKDKDNGGLQVVCCCCQEQGGDDDDDDDEVFVDDGGSTATSLETCLSDRQACRLRGREREECTNCSLWRRVILYKGKGTLEAFLEDLLCPFVSKCLVEILGDSAAHNAIPLFPLLLLVHGRINV